MEVPYGTGGMPARKTSIAWAFSSSGATASMMSEPCETKCAICTELSRWSRAGWKVMSSPRAGAGADGCRSRREALPADVLVGTRPR